MLSKLFLAKNPSPPYDPPLRVVVFLRSYISVWWRILLFLETIDAYNLLDHSAHYFFSSILVRPLFYTVWSDSLQTFELWNYLRLCKIGY